jgi:hypothetical protein
MPSVAVKLTKAQVADLTAICRLGASKLNALADALAAISTIRRSELRRIIVEVAGEESAGRLRRVLTGLSFAIRTRDVSPGDMLEAIGNAFSSEGLKEEDSLLWHECRPILEKLVSLPAVVLTTKARDLAEDFERALTNARILTDIRPVYNDSDDVVGAEVIQTLRIAYDSRGDSNTDTISFALDLQDIKKLHNACARAITKAESAAKLLRYQLGDEVIVIGEA